MADRLQTHVTVCGGGLVSNVDPLTQSSQLPGSALRLINYEPAIRGGYRRINGFKNTYGTVRGTGRVLGVYVDAALNEGLFACRAPFDGSGFPSYLYRWVDATKEWVSIDLPAGYDITSIAKVRFSSYNWGVPGMVVTDGVNPAYYYDGSTTVSINDELAPQAPKFSAIFASHVFLAGDSTEPNNLFFGAPLSQTDFTPAAGAGVINVGYEIVQIKSFRKELYIFGRNQIKKLTGTSVADFVLEDVTTNLGCVASDTVMEFGGDIIFMGPDGMRPISGTSKIGDVELESISRQVQDVFERYVTNENIEDMSSVIIRGKSQFRLFFANSESLSLIGAINTDQRTQNKFAFSQLIGVEASCAASGYIGKDEYVIHGDSTGRVHKQEEGYDFNGSNIISLYQTPYYDMGDPEVRNYYHSLRTYFLSEGVTDITVGVTYEYGDFLTQQPSNFSITTLGAAATFGSSSYDLLDQYDGNPSPSRYSGIIGSGRAISIAYVTDNTSPSHTIQAFTLTYGTADRR